MKGALLLDRWLDGYRLGTAVGYLFLGILGYFLMIFGQGIMK